MIQHIVTFEFIDRDPEGRSRTAKTLRATLEPLGACIPGVRSLTVGVDTSGIPGHWDAALLSVHDSAEALAEYQAHPAHLEALGIVAKLVSAKSVVDFEIGEPG